MSYFEPLSQDINYVLASTSGPLFWFWTSRPEHMRTVPLENAATQTFDLFTSKPHRNHALCIPEPKQQSKIKIECVSAQFCMGKLLHLPMDWIL